MKTNDELFRLSVNTKKLLVSSSFKKSPFSREDNALIRSINFQIKDNLTVSYCKPIQAKDNDFEVLKSLSLDYLHTGEDNFDKKFIILLAWNIFELKIISKKNNGEKKAVSFFEYEPGVFTFAPVTNKIFNLFLKHNDCKTRIGSALLMIYLNNYTEASEYFSDSLKKYLKTVKITRNINLFFNVNKAGNYAHWRIYSKQYKSFIRRLSLLNIRSSFFNTKYFQDAWYFWMLNKADACNPYIIEDLSCRYFMECTDAEKLLILAKIICKQSYSGKDLKNLLKNQLEQLFPVNPFSPENWIFECEPEYLSLLIAASNIIQRRFVKNPELLMYTNINENIRINRY